MRSIKTMCTQPYCNWSLQVYVALSHLTVLLTRSCHVSSLPADHAEVRKVDHYTESVQYFQALAEQYTSGFIAQLGAIHQTTYSRSRRLRTHVRAVPPPHALICTV